MVRRHTLSNVLAVLMLLLLLCSADAAAEEQIAAGDTPRSIADVPSWITGEIRTYTPESLGYSVNGDKHRDGYSLQNPPGTERTTDELPLWIQVAGISGTLVFLLALIHFLPVMIGRIKKTDPSPVRDSLYAAILASPGSSAADLREKTGIHHETLRYHLAVLDKEQKIISRKISRSYHYFPNGSSLSRADTIRMTLCQNPTTEKVLGLIEKEPGISGTVLAARAGISSGTLTWHLGRLQKNDLITISRVGRGMRIFPQDHT